MRNHRTLGRWGHTCVYSAFAQANEKVSAKSQAARWRWRRMSGLTPVLRRSAHLAVLAACAVFLLGIGPEDGPMVFLEDGPLQLDSQATEGTDTVVCNVGEAPLENVIAKAEGFPQGKGVAVAPNDAVGLARGDCQTFTLTPEAGLQSDAGEHKGALIVSADGVGSITRQLVVTPKA